MKKVLFFILTVIIFSGCSTIYRGYEGMPLSADKIAILEHPNAMHSPFILEDVDGKWRGMGVIERYELLPGEHSITCTLHNPFLTSAKITIFFKAEANKTYIAHAKVGNSRWAMLIIEKATQKVVSYTKGK